MLGGAMEMEYENSFCDLYISEMSVERVLFRIPIRRMQTEIS